jgi:hypothetical protein
MLLQTNVTRCTYQAEFEMAEVFRIKHATGGLNTALLGGQNLHVDPPRVVRKEHTNVAVIAGDVTIDAGGTIPVAITDVEHSLVNDVSLGEVKWVDPRLLLLPPYYREHRQ